MEDELDRKRTSIFLQSLIHQNDWRFDNQLRRREENGIEDFVWKPEKTFNQSVKWRWNFEGNTNILSNHHWWPSSRGNYENWRLKS